MKYIYFLILFTIINFSCISQDYSVEDQLLDCIYESFYNKGVDLKSELRKFENHLIKEKIIENNSGESYFKVFKIISLAGDYNFTSNYNLLDTLNNKIDKNFLSENINQNCNEIMSNLQNNSKFKKSKLYLLQKSLDSLKNQPDINTSIVAKKIIKILNAKDFNHDYYKTKALLVFASIDNNTVYNSDLTDNNILDDLNKIGKRNILNILITKENEIFIQNIKVEQHEINDKIKEFISNPDNIKTLSEKKLIKIQNSGSFYQSQGVILINSDRNTKYELYLDTKNKVLSAFYDIRNKFSVDFFGIPLDSLNKNQVSIVEKVIPININELEIK